VELYFHSPNMYSVVLSYAQGQFYLYLTDWESNPDRPARSLVTIFTDLTRLLYPIIGQLIISMTHLQINVPKLNYRG